MAAQQKREIEETTELKVSSTLPPPPPPSPPQQQQQISVISDLISESSTDSKTCVKDQSLESSTDMKTCVKDQSIEITDLKSYKLDDYMKICVKHQSSISPQQQHQHQQHQISADRTILITDLKSYKVADESSSVVSSSRKRQRGEVSRCSGKGCRRKIGLMPFRCRCGEVFCPEHRYSDRHDCNYDYKSAGRQAIAKENPVVKAAKIIKV